MDKGDYLGPTFFIDCDEVIIKDKSRELTANIEEPREESDPHLLFRARRYQIQHLLTKAF